MSEQQQCHNQGQFYVNSSRIFVHRMNTSIVFPTVMCQAFKETQEGSQEFLEWAKEKAQKQCKSTQPEEGKDIECAKEAMKQVRTYIDF